MRRFEVHAQPEIAEGAAVGGAGVHTVGFEPAHGRSARRRKNFFGDAERARAAEADDGDPAPAGRRRYRGDDVAYHFDAPFSAKIIAYARIFVNARKQYIPNALYRVSREAAQRAASRRYTSQLFLFSPEFPPEYSPNGSPSCVPLPSRGGRVFAERVVRFLRRTLTAVAVLTVRGSVRVLPVRILPVRVLTVRILTIRVSVGIAAVRAVLRLLGAADTLHALLHIFIVVDGVAVAERKNQEPCKDRDNRAQYDHPDITCGGVCAEEGHAEKDEQNEPDKVKNGAENAEKVHRGHQPRGYAFGKKHGKIGQVPARYRAHLVQVGVHKDD